MNVTRNQKSYLLLILIIFSLLAGCQKYTEQDKFKRPDWLPGKLYTTVAAQENLGMFAECLRLSGLDTIIDVSGSWTVFAPTNEAVSQYLMENNYSKVSDIPLDKLTKLAKFHIIQNPWSLEQLQELSIYGWRTSDNSNKNSYAYKRETILKNPVKKYWIKKDGDIERIVSDSLTADAYKKVYVESRKYAPVFYDKYIDINGITSTDFSFYFDRPYEHGNVYFAGAKILQADIFAENGFLHIVDKMMKPMLNAQEFLEEEYPGESYHLFRDMANWYYPNFRANLTATNNQPEVRLGGFADTIWDLDYPTLAFSLQKEIIGIQASGINETLVRHNGMYVPTDNAFAPFVDEILTANSGFPHWRDIQSLPKDLADIIVAQHFRTSPIYPTSNLYRQIFRSSGRFHQDEGSIVRQEFGSNCTFIGFDSYIPDKIFTSVTGPVFLRPVYSIFRLALQYTNLHDALANSSGELSFFPIPDYALSADSALAINWINKEWNYYNFSEYSRTKHQFENVSGSELSRRIRNHVGTSLPNGSANKEFIRNLNGNYIIWNNSDNTVQGNVPSTIGYDGFIEVTNEVIPLEEPADNGKAWGVRHWFNYEDRSMTDVLIQYPKFFSLLNKAGLYGHGFPFLNQNDRYTVFVPSDEALDSYQADTLNRVDLTRFLKHHFLRGAIIFTDNKEDSGEYNTASGEPLTVETSPDLIEIIDKNGNSLISIPEEENTTNIMVSSGTSTYAVVHEIDKVIVED